MTLKLATVWQGIAVYVTATGEAFSLSRQCGLVCKKFNVNALGRYKKNYCSRYYSKLTLNTSQNNVRSMKNYWFHILVCTAFHGPRPSPRHQVDHIDRDKWNNHPENLRWVTPRENQLNAKPHLDKLERLEREKRALLSTRPVQLTINFIN